MASKTIKIERPIGSQSNFKDPRFYTVYNGDYPYQARIDHLTSKTRQLPAVAVENLEFVPPGYRPKRTSQAYIDKLDAHLGDFTVPPIPDLALTANDYFYQPVKLEDEEPYFIPPPAPRVYPYCSCDTYEPLGKTI
jgi:hypothetical protein